MFFISAKARPLTRAVKILTLQQVCTCAQMTLRLMLLLGIIKPAFSVNTASSTITITIPAVVQISGLSDISLSPSVISSSVTGSSTACIYSNSISPQGAYFLTASSTNASAGTFRVVNGSNFISYSAYWNTTSAATQSISLTSGTKTTQLSGASATSLTCASTSGSNANFNLAFSVAQLAGATAATYTDTVTLIISPT